MVTAHEFRIFTGVTTHTTTDLKTNWKQFTLLVIINAFVGGMVGMERTLLPEIAQQNVQCYAFLYCGIRNRESHFKLFCRQSCQSSAEIALALVEKCKINSNVYQRDFLQLHLSYALPWG
jgi:hypothetical protein